MSTNSPSLNPSLAALRQFVDKKRQPREHCGLCSMPLAEEHPHLIEPETRRLVCACDACAMLFPNRPELKYRRVPRDARQLADFQLTNAEWDALLIPIGMAFFFYSSPANHVVALYPSPAGAMESLLDLAAWNDIAQANPRLDEMEPDVEALLVNRLGHAHGNTAAEYFLVPIDHCYKLVGLIRAHWRGLSGGTDVWREIQSFFKSLKGTRACSS